MDIYNRQKAITLWERVCGKEAARMSQAENLKGKTLFVSVIDHIWASELSGMTWNYLKKFEKILGTGVVNSIRFRAKPSAFKKEKKSKKSADYNPESIKLLKKEEKEIEAMAAEVEDEKARDLVKNILENRYRLDKWLKKRGGVECFGCGTIIEKGNTFCPLCLIDLEKENRSRLREKLMETPWITYKEAAEAVVPISLQIYDTIRKQLRDHLNREIVEGIEKVAKDARELRRNRYAADANDKKRELEKEISRIRDMIVRYALFKAGCKPAGLKDDVMQRILSDSVYGFFMKKSDELLGLKKR